MDNSIKDRIDKLGFSEGEIDQLKGHYLTNQTKYKRIVTKYPGNESEITSIITAIIESEKKSTDIVLQNKNHARAAYYRHRLHLDYDLSDYQVNALEFILNGSGNAVINAVAGSGKTTTIKLMAELLPEHIAKIFLAFSKSIVTELRSKLPDHIDVLTMNSIGWRAMINYYRKYGITVEIDQYKTRKIVDAALEAKGWEVDTDFIEDEITTNRSEHRVNKRNGEQWGEYIQRMKDEYVFEYKRRVVKLVDLIRLYLTKNEKELRQVAAKYDVDIYNGECSKALGIVSYMIKKNNDISKKGKKVFDFVDQIFIAATNKSINVPQYEYVFIDECQDLNVAQQRLMERLIKPKVGRFVAVGDPFQAIYGFAGADVTSFKKLSEKENTTILPLSVCYRCGTKIIDFARQIVPHIESYEGNGEGIVRNGKIFREVIEGDYILCRNTLPLIKLAYELLRMRKKVHIMGTDIAKTLITFVKRQKAKSINHLFEKFQKEIDFKVKKLKQKHLTDKEIEEHTSITSILEKIEVIRIIIEANDCKVINQIIYQIEDLFSDDKEGIVLSTIHKAKGLESKRVWIICQNLMPSKWAKNDWELEQEKNLMYVAYTRAIEELLFDTEFDYTLPY